MKTSLIILLCFVASFANARIGETLEECAERYGQFVWSEDGGAIFEGLGMRHACYFINNRCAGLQISRTDESGMSEAVRVRALMRNSGNNHWLIVDASEEVVTYRCESLQLGAYWNDRQKILHIFTKEFSDKLNADEGSN